MSAARGARARRRGGFTLTEILVVVGILGLLAGMLYAGVMGVLRSAHKSRTRVSLELLEAAIARYEAESWGDFPPGAGGVAGGEELLRALSDPGQGGPFLTDGAVTARDTDGNGRPEPLDDWKHPIHYTHHRHYSGEPRADSYRLESAGSDGIHGTRDDVKNWQ